MIKFFVAGEPRSMSVGTTLRAGKRTFQGRRGTPWAVLVGHEGRQHAPDVPLEGPVSFTAVFYMPRPATAPKRVAWPLKRPDVDNLFHKITDQWNGVFWRDDSQIVDVIVKKRFAEDGRSGVDIIVEPLAEIVPTGVAR